MQLGRRRNCDGCGSTASRARYTTDVSVYSEDADTSPFEVLNGEVRKLHRDDTDKALRNEIVQTWQCWMKQLCSAIERCPSPSAGTPGGGVLVYRAIVRNMVTCQADHPEGRQVRWSSITSTSLCPTLAYRVARDAALNSFDPAVMKDIYGHITLFCMNTYSGHEVDQYSDHDEAEVALLPYVRFVSLGAGKAELDARCLTLVSALCDKISTVIQRLLGRL